MMQDLRGVLAAMSVRTRRPFRFYEPRKQETLEEVE